MNRPYGSQPFSPPRQYQPSPEPPQPQWQASQAPSSGPGWRDPRQQQHHQPPPPAAQHTFNPNIHGPVPGTTYSPVSPPRQNSPDTASWGVRYNQNQHFTQFQQAKPPLPPRPPSVGGYGPSVVQQNETLGVWSQSQAPSAYVQPPQWQNDVYSHQQTQPVPPPPPPRPPAYLSLPPDAQGWPHPQYSHNPPSHHYEPSTQYSYQSGGSGDQHPQQGGSGPDANHTVSPIEPPTTYWRPPLPQTLPSDARNQSDSQLRKQTPKPRFGGPSDWEHFEPIADHVEETHHLETPTTSTQTNRQGAWHPGGSADLSHTLGGAQMVEALQQPQPDDSLIQQRFPVSATSAASSIAPPTPPAPLSVTRSHGDPPDSRGPSLRNEESPSLSMAAPQRTGTIDSVIQAWNKPVGGQGSWHAENPVSSKASSRQSSVSVFTATRPEGESAEITLQSPKQKNKSNPHSPPSSSNLDPYADLEPEYRASLSRYVTMLRKESEASSETGKYNIFKAFVDKELRLRSVLYGTDGSGSEHTKEANGVTAQHNPSAEAEERLREPPVGPTVTPKIQKSIPVVMGDDCSTSTPEIKNKAQSPKLAISTSPASNDDSFVVVDQSGDEVEYSPGGRPKVPKVPKVKTGAKGPRRSSSKTGTANPMSVTKLPEAVASPSDNAPMTLDDYSTGGPQSPGRNAPIVVDLQEDPSTRPGSAPSTSEAALITPLKFEPPRPVYTPFRYAEASRADLDKLKIQQPAYQAYTAMRQSADSGRILAQASTTTGSASAEAQDTFLGLIRSQSRAQPSHRPATPSNLLVKDPRTEASLALRALVPETLPDKSQHPKLADIGKEMEKIPDDFGFIHENVLRWDYNNRQVRDRQDRERRSRQEESERHIDALYNDNEIGYPDIATMEADFKLAEAKKKYEEDLQELESFTTQVFAPVTERLQTETFQLNSQHILAVDLLDSKSDSASHLMHSSEDCVPLSQVMEAVVSLSNKLDVRHRKSAEAHFERERRRKKLELTVLHANGDVAAMKTLEQKFIAAERLQVLHESQERDTRANILMDTFDRATARALGENQEFVDELCAKLRKMDAALAKDGKELSPNTFEPEDLHNVLSQAQAALDFVVADSNAILRASNTADTILNDADYAVSAAKAQMANSPAAAYGKLKEEKEKEDTKMGEDLEARLESIAKGPAEASALIEGIMGVIGRDPEHQERIQRALEAAKLRNATKDS